MSCSSLLLQGRYKMNACFTRRVRRPELSGTDSDAELKSYWERWQVRRGAGLTDPRSALEEVFKQAASEQAQKQWRRKIKSYRERWQERRDAGLADPRSALEEFFKQAASKQAQKQRRRKISPW